MVETKLKVHRKSGSSNFRTVSTPTPYKNEIWGTRTPTKSQRSVELADNWKEDKKNEKI